ncbi:MAG: hypothetical protein IT445_14995 [Phycisphaeraceae bacterium]|nr:hypothetical protein [Phycisphaeraceae bacterium]
MVQSYIPTTDAHALQWMQAFSGGITASPSTYMLSVSDATAISSAVDAYATALATATDPNVRTPVNVNIKDTTRNAAEQICRQYAILIKNNGGISDASKIAIGVRPVNPSREPIPCPQTSPLLNVVAATPGAHTVRYVDSMTPSTVAKPFGATELQLFIAIADAPTTDEDAAVFYGKFTKNPIGVAFAPGDDGKVATYFARWASRRGDVGPWSLPISMRIAA